jgi:anti-sigma B factor antagonist
VDLSLTTQDDGNAVVLNVSGEVDVYSAPTLGQRINEILDNATGGDSARRLVVDLNAVEFIDSTGLGTLVAGHNRARDLGGQMRLVCTVDRVIKLMRITGLDDVFTISPSITAALQD